MTIHATVAPLPEGKTMVALTGVSCVHVRERRRKRQGERDKSRGREKT